MFRWLFFSVLVIIIQSSLAYKIPAPVVAVFSRGLKVSIADSLGIELFVFHGRLNRALRANEPGEIHGDVLSADKDGRWTFHNDDKQLLIGDVINYWIYVQYQGIGYRLENQQFRVQEFGKEVQDTLTRVDTPLPVPLPCDHSLTRLPNGVSVCRGSVIFEDAFNSVDYEKWEPVTRFSSDFADAEFVTYQNRSENYYVRNGVLVIAPKLAGYTEHEIRTGQLDLTPMCTIDSGAVYNSRDCVRKAGKGYILPPVVSAKLRTKKSLTFRYGEVTIRAKVPKGDWIFPELYLNPARLDIYGPKNFASGQMRIGFVRGNTRLVLNGQDIDGTQLSGGLVVVSREEERSKWMRSKQAVTHFGDDFHNYTVTWTPTYISMAVDGEVYANFRDPICAQASNCARIPHADKWTNRGPMAPFDEDFYISIGVGVGGMGAFPDGAMNGQGQTVKPWGNTDNQAERNFYADLKNWGSTWTDESVLQVDHIKVTAL